MLSWTFDLLSSAFDLFSSYLSTPSPPSPQSVLYTLGNLVIFWKSNLPTRLKPFIGSPRPQDKVRSSAHCPQGPAIPLKADLLHSVYSPPPPSFLLFHFHTFILDVSSPYHRPPPPPFLSSGLSSL